MVVPSGTGNRRQSIYEVTGDGTTYQLNVRDVKMQRVEAAWVQNMTNDNPIQVRTENYDYPLQSTIELGSEGAPLDSDGKVLLFVIGY
jgi:hypothetical protein